MTSTNPNPAAPTRHRPGRALTVRSRLLLVAVVAIASLVGLVAFDTIDDYRAMDSLRAESATGRAAGIESLPLLIGAQTERSMTAAYAANPNPQLAGMLKEQRTKTDQGAEQFRRLSGTELKEDYRAKYEYVERVYEELDRLDEVRAGVDDGSVKVDDATGYFSEVITRLIQVYQALSDTGDAEISRQGRPLVGQFWAGEAMSQEDMLIAQAGVTGRMSAAHRQEFAAAYGAQRVMYERWIVPYLPASEKALYDKMVASDAWKIKEKVEQGILNAPTDEDADGALTQLPPETRQWQEAYIQIAQDSGQLNLARTEGLLETANQITEDAQNKLWWKAGLSAAAVVVLALLILWITRTIITRTNQLRGRAATVAEKELPSLVGDLLDGKDADLSVLPQPKPNPRDEFEQIGNDVARLAQEAANAALIVHRERRGFGRFAEGVSARAVVILGRRLLTQLDELEERYGDDEQLLHQLYEVDHQAVRVRRLIENLLVLSGGGLDQAHNRPVHVANVLLDAAGESAGFKRVVKDFRAEAWIPPHLAGELTHLLAELIDNSAIYSPNDFEITVRSIPAAAGVAIEVEDRGFLRAEQVVELNDRLSTAPTYGDLAESAHQLGLFVVGQLARRLGVSVTLRESPYRGVQAIVFIPDDLLADRPQTADDAPGASTEPVLAHQAAALPYDQPAQHAYDEAPHAFDEPQHAYQPAYPGRPEGGSYDMERDGGQPVPGGWPAQAPNPAPDQGQNPGRDAGQAPYADQGNAPAGPAARPAAPEPEVTSAGLVRRVPHQSVHGISGPYVSGPSGRDAGGARPQAPDDRTAPGAAPVDGGTSPSWSRHEGQFVDSPVSGPTLSVNGGAPAARAPQAPAARAPQAPAARAPQAPVAPATPTVPGLPQRVPGTHLAPPLRDEDVTPSTPQHAVDGRSLDEIEDVFSALDDIKHIPDGGYR